MGEETNLQKLIAASCCSKSIRLWVNDNGMAWHGKVTRSPDGDYGVIKHPRAFKYGLGVGISDLIGFKMTKITKDMVGTELPVFTGIEVKTKTGRVSEEQKNFLAMLRDHNGVAGIARSVEEAKQILDGYKPD